MDYSSLRGTSTSFHLLLGESHRREGRKKVSAGGLEDCSKAVFQIERSYCTRNLQQLWLPAESLHEIVLVRVHAPSQTEDGLWTLFPSLKSSSWLLGKGKRVLQRCSHWQELRMLW